MSPSLPAKVGSAALRSGLRSSFPCGCSWAAPAWQLGARCGHRSRFLAVAGLAGAYRKRYCRARFEQKARVRA
eukprot:11123086-Alexandrium_andersonii.AAC.1